MSDAATQVRSTRAQAGWTRVPRELVRFAGADRTAFLNNMTTNDVRRLEPGRQGCFAAMVNRTGKMIATLKIRAMPEEILADIDNADEACEALQRAIVMDDVRLERVTRGHRLFGVYGPEARELLGLADTPPWGLRGRAMRVLTTGEDGYELWLEDSEADRLEEELGRKGAARIGPEAYELLHAEHGHPLWGAELDGGVLPVEANLESLAISYTKGCYVGQEIIQRIKTYSQAKQALKGLTIDGPPPKAGAEVAAGPKPAGRVTRGFYSPTLDRPVALAYIRREFAAAGTKVLAGGVAAEVVDLPFVEHALTA